MKLKKGELYRLEGDGWYQKVSGKVFSFPVVDSICVVGDWRTSDIVSFNKTLYNKTTDNSFVYFDTEDDKYMLILPGKI